MKKNIMKKILAAGITATMILGTAAIAHAEPEIMFEGKQTASGRLDQGENEVLVTVDLSDGWSAYFAPGAVYLYDGPTEKDKEAIAVGLTIDQTACHRRRTKGFPHGRRHHRLHRAGRQQELLL